MRLIDADVLKKHIDEVFCKPCSHKGAMCDACYMDDALYQIECAPSVDAAPVRHGRWEEKMEYAGYVCCSVCHDCYVEKEWIINKKWAWCPQCGARLKED